MLSTLKRMLKSRKWLALLAAFIVGTGVIAFGWDEANATAMADKVLKLTVVLAGLGVFGTALEDAAEKFGALKERERDSGNTN